MRRFLALVLAVPLAAASVGACARSDPAPPSASAPAPTGSSTTAADAGIGAAVGEGAQKEADRIKAAAGKAGAASSGRVSLVVSVVDNPALGPGDATVVDMSGSFTRGGDRSELTVDFSGLAQSGGLSAGDLGGAEPTSVLAEPIEIVKDGADVYYKSEPLLATLGVTTPWMRTDSGADAFAALFASFAPANVAAFLDALGSMGDVRDVGRESVGGVRTTHDQVEVDLATLDDTARDAVSRLFGDLGDTGTARFDVWVDADGNIRRLRISASAEAVGKALDARLDGASATATIEFTDLGKPVTVTVPSDDDVTDRSTGTSTTTTRARPSTTNPYRK